MKNITTLYTKENLSVFTVWLFSLSGMIGISIGYFDWFIIKTPLNLLILFGLLILNFPILKPKAIGITVLIFLGGFAVEWAGVHSGVLFGEYYYGSNFGFKIDGIPPLIGINWVILTLTSAAIAQKYIENKWLRACCGALLMVSLDFFIEPLAPIFDFWHWSIGHAPLQNFTTWFIVAFLMHLLYSFSKVESSFRFPIHAFASQALFFIYFYFFYS